MVSGSTAEPPRPPRKCHPGHTGTAGHCPPTLSPRGSRAELIHGILSIPKSVRTRPSSAQVSDLWVTFPVGTARASSARVPTSRRSLPTLSHTTTPGPVLHTWEEVGKNPSFCGGPGSGAGARLFVQQGLHSLGSVAMEQQQQLPAEQVLLSPPCTSTLQIKAWQQAGSSGKTSTK